MTTENTKASILKGRKKFLAYVLGNVLLIVFAFVLKPDPKMVLSVLAIINGGYWSVEGALDAVRAVSAKNGKE